MVAQGTPADAKRLALFEVLAAHLRTCPLPHIEERVPTGVARHHCALIESYFSNYVEGTKFNIKEACDIVLNNRPVTTRPKDSHDLLAVFRLAITAPFRNNPPVCGADFLEDLQAWHADKLKMRAEANPGQLKLEPNYAGDTKFVEPMLVSRVRSSLNK